MTMGLLLFIAAYIAWLIGTITAGGASIIFLLLLTIFLPITIIPVIIGFVGTFAGIYRTFMYRREVYWPIIKWLLPGTIAGALIGASVFSVLITQSGERFLELLLGFLLILSGGMGFLKKNPFHAKAQVWFFLPGGFVMAMISGMIGSAPPLVNVLYQGFPLSPNQIVGTKSVNLFTLQLTKSLVYAAFIGLHFSGHLPHSSGAVTLTALILLALFASIGAALGISSGKVILNRLNKQVFNRLVNTMLILFGCYFLYLWFR